MVEQDGNVATPTALGTTARLFVSSARQEVAEQLRHPAVYLVPLRIFMGLGWLRTAAEKLAQSDWAGAPSAAEFLTRQLRGGHVEFPAYEWLIRTLWLPNAGFLEWVIVGGEILVGFGILLGICTNGALLGALFMNFNFLLVGRVNPNAFYIVIQVILLLSYSGQVFGFDSWLGRYVRNPLLVAQPPAVGGRHKLIPTVFVIGAFVSLALAVYAIPYITDLSPAGSVEDPAMLLVILGLLGVAWSALAYCRNR